LSFMLAGSTYNPDQGEVLGLPGVLDTCMSHIAEVCAVCNESKLDCSEGTYKGVGAPTEASLKVRWTGQWHDRHELAPSAGLFISLAGAFLFASCMYCYARHRTLHARK
jgi:hypothetical protein